MKGKVLDYNTKAPELRRIISTETGWSEEQTGYLLTVMAKVMETTYTETNQYMLEKAGTELFRNKIEPSIQVLWNIAMHVHLTGLLELIREHPGANIPHWKHVILRDLGKAVRQSRSF